MKIFYYDNNVLARQELEWIGVEGEFFDTIDRGGDDQRILQSPVWVLTSLEHGLACAVVVLYRMSHEIGLWVRPDLRCHGLGTRMMKAALADGVIGAGPGPIYARTSIRPAAGGPAMRKILECSGFRRVIAGSCLDLWVFRR